MRRWTLTSVGCARLVSRGFTRRVWPPSGTCGPRGRASIPRDGRRQRTQGRRRGAMFSITDRERVRDRLVERARADPDVAAAALVGSTATGGDRWSNLDLTFGVARGVPVAAVLERWTRE